MDIKDGVFGHHLDNIRTSGMQPLSSSELISLTHLVEKLVNSDTDLHGKDTEYETARLFALSSIRSLHNRLETPYELARRLA